MKKVVPGSLKRNQLDFFSHIASSRFCRTCLLFPVLFFSVFVSSGYPAGSEKLLYQNPGQADWDFTSGLVRRELNRKPGQKTASDPGRVIRALMELECGESGTISSFDEQL
ncbi:MAG: hypothetical protein ACE5FU_09420, partial [Nitrospinota bacterium]